jgi:hypothetical protein
MMANRKIEFQLMESGLSFDTLRARGLSLRDLGRGCEDPRATVMPFERDESGGWRASRWIGIIRHKAVTYTIVPRIGESLFRRIAVEAVSVALLPDGAGPGQCELRDLLDLLPLVWCLSLRRARSSQAIPRLYVTRRAANRKNLRGRFDLPRQLTENRCAQHHLACIWSELTFDNPITRMMLMTIDHLAHARRFPFGGKAGEFARELKELQSQLLVQGTLRHTNLLEEPIFWSRANDRYRAVHEFGRAIVRGRGADGAPAEGDAILLDSAEIWELFLFARLRTILRKYPKLEIEWPREQRSRPQMLLEWNGRHTRALIPDIVISEIGDSGRIAIIDAKSRNFASASPDQDTKVADQMALYAMNADAARTIQPDTPPTMVLLFPTTQDQRFPEGLNSNRKSGINGQGKFLFRGGREYRLIAWCVPLPQSDVKFRAVDENLETMLNDVFPAL